MSRLTRYTLAALGAIALSVTSYAIGNATAQEPSPTEPRDGIRTVELAPMSALGADTAVLATFTERARWDEALRWRALADVGSEGVRVDRSPSDGGTKPSSGPAPSGDSGFLACVRAHASDTAGGYQASNGTHFGAYQFAPSTWNSAASRSGRTDLIGMDPRNASPADQDAMATYLYETDGAGHWAGSGCQ